MTHKPPSPSAERSQEATLLLLSSQPCQLLLLAPKPSAPGQAPGPARCTFGRGQASRATVRRKQQVPDVPSGSKSAQRAAHSPGRTHQANHPAGSAHPQTTKVVQASPSAATNRRPASSSDRPLANQPQARSGVRAAPPPLKWPPRAISTWPAAKTGLGPTLSPREIQSPGRNGPSPTPKRPRAPEGSQAQTFGYARCAMNAPDQGVTLSPTPGRACTRSALPPDA